MAHQLLVDHLLDYAHGFALHFLGDDPLALRVGLSDQARAWRAVRYGDPRVSRTVSGADHRVGRDDRFQLAHQLPVDHLPFSAHGCAMNGRRAPWILARVVVALRPTRRFSTLGVVRGAESYLHEPHGGNRVVHEPLLCVLGGAHHDQLEKAQDLRNSLKRQTSRI